MISGIAAVLVAGTLLAVQGVLNSKLSEVVSGWATTAWVLGLGALASLTLGLFLEGAEMFTLRSMQPWYWGSGILGIGVVLGLVESIRRLGPTFAVSLVLASQLAFAVLWDATGWLGVSQTPLSFKRVLGVSVIIAGILLFKLGGTRDSEASSEARTSPEGNA